MVRISSLRVSRMCLGEKKSRSDVRPPVSFCVSCRPMCVLRSISAFFVCVCVCELRRPPGLWCCNNRARVVAFLMADQTHTPDRGVSSRLGGGILNENVGLASSR